MVSMAQEPHSLENQTFYDSQKNALIHYTCNAPSEEILGELGIKPIGDEYGCDDVREVVEVPVGIYLERGFMFTKDFDLLRINLENLMRNLSQ